MFDEIEVFYYYSLFSSRIRIFPKIGSALRHTGRRSANLFPLFAKTENLEY